ncbi:MAG TPA: C-GCAxxG-C-C family protein, partial [Anaerovoracaceae bacterium]|nr:C-GCAxxG-C-C family protein [Anaerovoracaceae bacterium]
NCAQCVVCAYCDVVGLDEKTMFRVAEGFGAGMGDFQGTCGALTGAFMLTGLTTDGTGIDGPKTKQETYRKVKELAKNFQDMNSSVICRELKGMTGGAVLRSCDGCIEDGVRIAGEMLMDKGYLI